MSSNVKMVVRIGDKEEVVGRCHPGQARILRRCGMAEWDKDRLVLRRVEDVGGSATPVQTAPEQDTGAWAPYSWEKPLEGSPASRELFLEIDPEGLIGGITKRIVFDGEEIFCESLDEWISQIRSRQQKGNTLYCADNPRSLHLGFIDDTENVWVAVPLRYLRRAGPTDYKKMGIHPDHIRTNVGRVALINPSKEFSFAHLPPSQGPLEYSPVQQLESLWMKDAWAEIATFQENANQDLAAEWGLNLLLERSS